jgi:hypothetical protein
LTGLVRLPAQREFTPSESKVPAGNRFQVIWRTQKKDFRSFLGGFAAALLQIDFLGFSLLASSVWSKMKSAGVAQGAAVKPVASLRFPKALFRAFDCQVLDA